MGFFRLGGFVLGGKILVLRDEAGSEAGSSLSSLLEEGVVLWSSFVLVRFMPLASFTSVIASCSDCLNCFSGASVQCNDLDGFDTAFYLFSMLRYVQSREVERTTN